MDVEQDLVKKLEEMMAKMMEKSMAPILKRLQKIEVNQGKQTVETGEEDEDLFLMKKTMRTTLRRRKLRLRRRKLKLRRNLKSRRKLKERGARHF